MCGIGGIVLFDGGPPDAAGMQRMVDALRHRGPDDEGFWVQAAVGMAHTRLSVIDLTPAGRQPMHVESPSLSIVYTGKFYNHPEYRQPLQEKGQRLLASADTAAILLADALPGRAQAPCRAHAHARAGVAHAAAVLGPGLPPG